MTRWSTFGVLHAEQLHTEIAVSHIDHDVSELEVEQYILQKREVVRYYESPLVRRLQSFPIDLGLSLLRQPRAPLTCSIVSDDKSFGALRSEWESLFCRAAVQTPFLRYSWLRLCWNRNRKVSETHLFIVVVRDDDRPVLIAPLLRRRGILSFLNSNTPQYNDILVEDSPYALAYVKFFWETLVATRTSKRFAALWVRNNSSFVKCLSQFTQPSRLAAYRATFVDLQEFSDWSAYLGSLSKKLRSDHGRQLRRLTKRGCVDVRMASSHNLPRDMAWLFDHKREWLVKNGKSADWVAAPETEALFTSAAEEGRGAGRTELIVLSVDGSTAAAVLSFREGSTLYLSKIAYDSAWHTYSPGRTLVLLTIERAFQEGIKRCELMTGRGSWKEKLTNGKVTVWNAVIPFNGQ